MFEHFVLVKMRIINMKKNEPKQSLCASQFSSVVSSLVKESVRVRVNGLQSPEETKRQPKLALKLIKGHKLYSSYLFHFHETFAVGL